MKTARTLIATYYNFFGSLDGWLAKAEDDPRGYALLGHRLADDMHPLARQIRFVCNLPGEAMARAAGAAFTPSDEDDATLSAARARVSAARDRVRGRRDITFPPDDSPVELALPNGMTFDLDIETYARDWALAQLYFHLVIAYAIPARRRRAAGQGGLCRLHAPAYAAARRAGSGLSCARSRRSALHAPMRARMSQTLAKPATPYDALGGAQAIARIVERFYDLMDSDPAYRALRAMHAADLGPMRASLTGWLSAWAGGPQDWFSANPGKCMMSYHRTLGVTAKTAGQWSDAMARSIAEAGPADKALGQMMAQRLDMMAQAMVRR